MTRTDVSVPMMTRALTHGGGEARERSSSLAGACERLGAREALPVGRRSSIRSSRARRPRPCCRWRRRARHCRLARRRAAPRNGARRAGRARATRCSSTAASAPAPASGPSSLGDADLATLPLLRRRNNEDAGIRGGGCLDFFRVVTFAAAGDGSGVRSGLAPFSFCTSVVGQIFQRNTKSLKRLRLIICFIFPMLTNFAMPFTLAVFAMWFLDQQ